MARPKPPKGKSIKSLPGMTPKKGMGGKKSGTRGSYC